jgi:uncharacterized membrane protein YgcG
VPVVSSVTEQSATLTADDIKTLDAEIQEVRGYTGTTVIVVLFEGLNGNEGRAYADGLLSCYAFDNSKGVVMVYSRIDNQMYVATTAKLATVVTDKVRRQLLDGTAGTHLYNHQVGPALKAAVQHLGSAIAVADGLPAKRVKTEEQPSLTMPITLGVLGIVVSSSFTMFVVSRLRRRKQGVDKLIA